MSSSNSTIYLITGASRGIGLALVRELCARFKDIAVVAGVRDPSNVPALDQVASEYPSVVDIVKYAAADVENNKALAEHLRTKYGRIDVVIANAGIGSYTGSAAETPIDEMRKHWEVNALGPLVLFQSLLSLLRASKNPKFIPITSGAGSSAYYEADFGQLCYGSSKAVLNFIAKKIHCENEWITAFPLAPGIIDTDMSTISRKDDKTGVISKLQDDLMVSTEVGGRMLIDIIEASTRATHGGEYLNLDGSKLPW